MGRAARDYTTEDAINDYRFWKSAGAAAQAFEQNAPPPRPGAVHDFDFSQYNAAHMRLARHAPTDVVGTVLMLEAVIFELEDDDSPLPTDGLRALQATLADHIRRDRDGLIDTDHLLATSRFAPLQIASAA